MYKAYKACFIREFTAKYGEVFIDLGTKQSGRLVIIISGITRLDKLAILERLHCSVLFIKEFLQ